MTHTSSLRYFVNPYQDYKNVSDDCFQSTIDSWIDYIKDTLSQCMKKMKPKPDRKYCDGGLYTGNLGLLFVNYKLLSKNVLPLEYQKYMKQYISACLKANAEYYGDGGLSKSSRDAQFLLGKGGFHIMACLNAKFVDEQEDLLSKHAKQYADLASICLPLAFLSNGSDEMFVGRAGYLCGILLLRKCLNINPLGSTELFQLCDAVVESGREYSKNTNSPSPLMYAYHGTQYLGSAHGVAGILQILLSFPDYLGERREAEANIKNTIDFLLSLQQENGNFPTAMDNLNNKKPRQSDKELIHWCHGAGGLVFLFAKAYLHWREEKYLNASVRCGNLIWKCGLLKKGPGICHGIAGGGYAHLILYRLTNNKAHLYRAQKFAEFLHSNTFRQEANMPDSPFSLFEGLGGTVCFIADLLDTKNAEFPLIPIF